MGKIGEVFKCLHIEFITLRILWYLLENKLWEVVMLVDLLEKIGFRHLLIKVQINIKIIIIISIKHLRVNSKDKYHSSNKEVISIRYIVKK
jgi:hypothetical protein